MTNANNIMITEAKPPVLEIASINVYLVLVIMFTWSCMSTDKRK
jgi:hypothetical protein